MAARAWKARNRHAVSRYNKEWVARNPEYQQNWRDTNRDYVRERERKAYWANPDAMREKGKRWRTGPSRPKHLACVKRRREKLLSTPEGRLCKRMRFKVKKTLREMGAVVERGAGWEKLVGYTRHELLAHLVAQFTKGMTIAKFLRGEIHIDHIRPLMTFQFTSENDPQFKECWALSNLRPLWAHHNNVRGANHRWERHKKGTVTI